MKKFPLLRSTVFALLPCFLVLHFCCYTTAPVATTVDHLDRNRSLIVGTKDSLSYRFDALEWSRDPNGDIVGMARRYSSLEDANQGSGVDGQRVTIPVARIASLHEPGDSKPNTLGVAIVIAVSVGVIYLLGLAIAEDIQSKGCGASHL